MTQSSLRVAAIAAVLSVTALSARAADSVVSFATGGYATGIRTMEFLHAVDTNGDGMISRDEWLAFQEKTFAMLDRKKTGVIDAKEYLGADRPAMVSFATGGYATGLLTHEMMAKIDTDGDGTISHDEFIAYQMKVFDMMDTSRKHRGQLSPAELFATAGQDPR